MNAFSILKRNPNFFLVWLGQILSQSGARVYQMAILWWILSVVTENGGTWVGSFMVMTALPSILFMKKIGKVIDQGESRQILVRADLLSALVVTCVAFLFWKAVLSLPVALIVGFGGAILQAFIDPTLNKALSEVVRKEDFESGLALLSTTQSLANFAGAVLGALLIDRLGFSGTAMLAAFGYFVSAFASSRAVFQKSTESKSGEEAVGWEILRGYPLLSKLLVGFGLVNFFATPTLVVLPVYVKKVLLGSASHLGTLEASLWLGLLGGALVSRYIVPEWDRIRAGVLCLLVFGVCLLVPGIIVSIPLYWAALALAGLALGANNVKFMSFFQETVDPAMKGRFFALMQGIIGFTFPIAFFTFGSLTDTFPVQTVCLIQGLGVIVLAFYFVPFISRNPEVVRD